MAEPVKEMPVFISFATADQTIAGMVCNALEQNGIDCWVSWRNIALGEDFPNRLQLAIKESRVVVLVFSKAACKSRFIAREIQIALENEKTIIPFRIENVQPENNLGFHLAGVQWLDAFLPPIEDHLKKLVEQVAAVIDKPIVGQIVVPKAKKRSIVSTPVVLVAVVVLLTFLGLKLYFMLQLQTPSDESIRSAVVTKLHESLDAHGVAIDCPTCPASQPHLHVEVAGGAVNVLGEVSAADVAAVHGLQLQLPGVRSVAYEVSALPPVSTITKATELKTRAAGNTAPFTHAPQEKEAEPQLTADQLRVKAFILRGKDALKQGNFVSAENQFQAALNLEPDNQEAQSGIAEARTMRDKANY